MAPGQGQPSRAHLLIPLFHFGHLENAVPGMEKQVQTLTNYLWSRHVPVEAEELQRRAAGLERLFLETPGRLGDRSGRIGIVGREVRGIMVQALTGMLWL